MEYAPLGRTGVQISRICLGTALFGLNPVEQDVPTLVDRALDLGINFFDTANTYGNRAAFDRPDMPKHTERKSGEELLGTALKGKRQDIILASKVGEQRYQGENGRGLSRQHIMRAIDDTLRRLQTDWIDLYYAHWPDPKTPIEETLDAMGDLVRAGKIRYFGLSNSSGWQVAEAALKGKMNGSTIPVCNQIPYSAVRRHCETEIVPACQQFGLSIMPYSGLHGGLLTGTENTKRKIAGMQRWRGGDAPGYTANEVAIAEKIQALAAGTGHTPGQLAAAWLLSKPQVTSIVIGASRIASLEDAVGALDVELTEDQFAELESYADLM